MEELDFMEVPDGICKILFLPLLRSKAKSLDHRGRLLGSGGYSLVRHSVEFHTCVLIRLVPPYGDLVVVAPAFV